VDMRESCLDPTGDLRRGGSTRPTKSEHPETEITAQYLVKSNKVCENNQNKKQRIDNVKNSCFFYNVD